MAVVWLPELERDEHGRALYYTDADDAKGCLHTTETLGWPDYSGWTVPPQITVMPIPGVGVKGRQHIPLNRAGFALRNLSGGVQTNTDNVVQVELVGTCERGGRVHKAGAYLWPDADDAVLLDLYRKVILPVSQARGIPVRALRFQAYPASYGARSGTNNVRLSGPAWDTYSGWLGHQHAPENAHGDPGAFPWNRMIALQEDDDMATADDVWKVKADRFPAPTPADPDDGLTMSTWLRSAQTAAVGARDNAAEATRAAQEAAVAAQAASAAAVAATQAAGRTEAAVKALTVGGIDVDALADAVADKLAARLKD